ncbi:MAG: 5'-3' exonuclease H3TH domain-containing protein [Patescibacteria group bacterium]
MTETKNLIIIDAFSLLYRAFHALPPLTNKKGQPTGAVYGFLLTLFKAIKDLQSNYIVACFDTPKPTFRHQEFKEYKIHRPEMPKDIASQIPVMKEVLQAFNIPIFEKDGYEADDLIATIAQIAKKEADVFILSGDLDNLQLVDERVKVYTLGKGIKDSVIYDNQKVVERFGVQPSQMNDFKALTGDNSDNIPGVPGVGKVAAADLIQRFGTVESLYQELATDTAVLKPKIKEALKENKDKALLSLQLVKTKKDVPLEFILEQCKFNGFDRQKVKDIFIELGFNTLIERLSTIGF